MKKICVIIIVINSFLYAQISSSASSKLQSLIVPGLGEFKMGYEKKARAFFIREAALWLVFIGGKQASSWFESNYLAFAELHADVNMVGKNYIFAVNMGHYNSMSEFNEAKLLQRQENKIYKEEEGYEWQWDNNKNRIHFDRMRIESVTYNKYTQFAIGGLVLHRLISLIDVIYLERRFPKVSFTPQISTNTGNLQFKLLFKLK